MRFNQVALDKFGEIAYHSVSRRTIITPKGGRRSSGSDTATATGTH
jgi:hypothetical protein